MIIVENSLEQNKNLLKSINHSNPSGKSWMENSGNNRDSKTQPAMFYMCAVQMDNRAFADYEIHQIWCLGDENFS